MRDPPDDSLGATEARVGHSGGCFGGNNVSMRGSQSVVVKKLLTAAVRSNEQ